MSETKSQSGRDKAFWQELNQTYEGSGEGQAAFCLRHGVTLSAFRYWRSRLRRLETPSQKSEVRLLPVRLRDESCRPGDADRRSLEICRDRVTVRVPEGMDTVYVGSLLHQIFVNVC